MLSTYVVLSLDAIISYKKHHTQLELVQNNFNGRCTDSLNTVDFGIKWEAMEESRRNATFLILPSYVIVGLWVIQFLWHIVNFHCNAR